MNEDPQRSPEKVRSLTADELGATPEMFGTLDDMLEGIVPDAPDTTRLCLRFTTAPASYDGFSMRTLGEQSLIPRGHTKHDVWRAFIVEQRDLEWAVGRITSGSYPVWTWRELVQNIQHGILVLTPDWAGALDRTVQEPD